MPTTERGSLVWSTHSELLAREPIRREVIKNKKAPPRRRKCDRMRLSI